MKIPNMVDKQIGDRVRSRRIALDISEEQLAAALESQVQKLQEWETGTVRIGAAGLQKLTELLGVDPAFFFANVQPNGSESESESETGMPSQSILASPPALEILRLIRAFRRIESCAFREVVIELAEAIAGTGPGSGLDS